MKVVFFVFDPSPRIHRRIVEFIKNGYDVDVYGFANDVNIKYCTNDVYKYNVLAKMYPKMPYSQRLKQLRLITDVIHKYSFNSTLFYFFTLNVAISTILLRKIKYIYEESDMLFDRFHNTFLRKLVINVNKHIIKNSLLTVFTSEGFGDFYYGNQIPNNICVVPNKVDEECLNLSFKTKAPADIKKLKFGFVGNIRYQSILNVSRIISEKFPNYEFHYFGSIQGLSSSQKEELSNQKNVVVHGPFSNPVDLPSIYSSIDFLVCTYDTTGINPRYAEPNKLYEAIYFRTPIIVSNNSFLAKKVSSLGIGFSIDASDSSDIEKKIQKIELLDYEHYLNNLNKIPQKDALNINHCLFKRIKEICEKS